MEIFLKEFADFRKEIYQRFDGVNHRLDGIDHRLNDIDRTLKPLAQAVDKDAETIVSHGRRITRIEKRLGFESK